MESARQAAEGIYLYIPSWVVYSLPNALWIFSYTTIIAYLWIREEKSLISGLWLLSPVFLGMRRDQGYYR
jgi:hypothetical protein